MLQAIRNAVNKRMSALVLAILVVQPMLDVLSYFLAEMDKTSLSTLLRMALLMAVALLGFLSTGRKKLYFLFYALAGVFWVCHMLNCRRLGYQSFVTDTANYLRVLSLPIYTLAFAVFFRADEGVGRSVFLGFAVNFAEILLFTALPWALGRPVYTYELIRVGVMGWFGVANAQSAIIVLAAPLTVYWGLRTEKYPVFLLTSLLCFGLMFITGTKLAFYSIFIIAGAYCFLFFIERGKKCLKYALPLLGVMVLVFLLRGYSPMAARETLSAEALGQYDQLVGWSLENSGADEETLEAILEGVDLTDASPQQVEKVRRTLIGIYTDKNVYGRFLRDFHARFGAYTVMDSYRYSIDSATLSDSRVRKATFAKLLWQEKDFPTRLLGFEYSDMFMGDATYDLENDFPALFYFCGYLGFAAYMVFLGYLFFVVLRAFLWDVGACAARRKGKKENFLFKGLGTLWQAVCRFLTPEMGAVGMTFLLAVIAAQISGNVLRRPNVAIYVAAAAAYAYHLAADLHRQETPRDQSGDF